MIGVTVLGAGGRARGVVKNLLRDSNRDVRVLSVFDPDRAEARKALAYWDAPDARVCGSFAEALAVPDVQWAMVFSPNAYHKEQIVAAFAAGLHVFSEKPLATTIEDCVAIRRAHEQSGRLFATGFVLRYAPLYRAIRELLDSGRFGKIIGIAASENIPPEHGGYIMANWRRHTAISGPHLLEKCCHDLDLLNWFCGDVPRRAAAFAGLDVFIPENERLMAKYGAKTFRAWPDPHGVASPFTSDKDILDNYICMLEYRNGPRVSFQATMANALPERRMYIACLEGTIVGELYSGTLRHQLVGEKKPTDAALPGGGHGGGDDYIMKELYDTMTRGTPPKCSGEEGLRSAVVALVLDQAAREGRIIDLEPIWASLGQ